jgi:hypothetical protein
MNREIGVERLYSLGDYKNIKFSDVITDIKQEYCVDQNLMEKVRYLQMLAIETSFYRYIELAKRIGTVKQEEAMELLSGELERTLEEIKQILKN